MHYQYATKQQDYSDYASGRVLYSRAGAPAFPVRLASEVFQRAYGYWLKMGRNGRSILYDPCCGGAYHLAVLGFLHGDKIGRIIGSDVDSDILELAGKNLGLLTAVGRAKRRAELETMLQAYQKASHQAALESMARLEKRGVEIEAKLFQADALEKTAVGQGLDGAQPDIVFADVPYGSLTLWQSKSNTDSLASQPPITQLLTTLLPHLAPQSILIIASDKSQKAAHPNYRRLERLRAGKRQIFILQRTNPPTI
ncbi:MAG: hypothetical protein AAF614_07770 [Chloroflexota bacterium]